MPALSPTMSEGNIVSWSKKEGDQVKVGDVLCDIQTDKATMGFESQEDGYLAKILVPTNSKGVEVGKLIGLLVEEKKDIEGLDISKYTSQAVAPKIEEKKEVSQTNKSEGTKQTSAAAVTTIDFSKEYHSQEEKFKITPSAGYYLRTFEVLPSEVKASGPKNYIQKGDVL